MDRGGRGSPGRDSGFADAVREGGDMKTKTKLNGWELNTGMFEIYWQNDVAVKVRIEGATFYSRHAYMQLKRAIPGNKVPAGGRTRRGCWYKVSGREKMR